MGFWQVVWEGLWNYYVDGNAVCFDYLDVGILEISERDGEMKLIDFILFVCLRRSRDIV